MKIAKLNGLHVHYRDEGPRDGAPVVFANSLGTDLRLWDKLIAELPDGLRLVRCDKRGHGLTDVLPAPYSMGSLVSDAEALIDHLSLKNVTFVGLSIGGMIAQGLAVKRPDLIGAMVVSNSAAKIGTAEMWRDRMATVESQGIEALAESVMERWFSSAFRASDELAGWRNMLCRQPKEGYAGCCAAIAGSDFYTPTSGLTLPSLFIAGSEDGSTPPDLVRETAELIKGSSFELIRGAGHLPCVEAPKDYARILTTFLDATGRL